MHTRSKHIQLKTAYLRRNRGTSREYQLQTTHWCSNGRNIRSWQCRSAEADEPASSPYSGVPLEELKDRLELLVRGEDYATAANIRDEIKKRESNVEVAVGEAHQAFYTAFGNGDFKAMEKAWGDGSHVQVMHPGSDPIRGRKDVLESWKIILGGGQLNIELEQVQIHALDNLAFVTCIEVMRTANAKGRTGATNILEKQGGRWVLVHHQGGPLVSRP